MLGGGVLAVPIRNSDKFFSTFFYYCMCYKFSLQIHKQQYAFVYTVGVLDPPLIFPPLYQ